MFRVCRVYDYAVNPKTQKCAGEGNVAIWGTPPDSIDDAEDRDKWYELLTRLDIRQPPGGMVTSEAGALAEAAKLGYPVRQLTPVLGWRVQCVWG